MTAKTQSVKPGRRTSVILPGAMRDAAEKRARSEGITLSALIHRAMEEYLGVSVPKLERGKYPRDKPQRGNLT